MRPGYGLCAATDSWVTVSDRLGGQFETTPLKALTDPACASLAGDPPVVVAVLRLLTAIVLDATGGPQDEAEWARWWVGGLPTAPIRDYLERHAPRMFLHGPRPFLQDPETPERTGLKSVAELAPHLPTGANAVIYRRTTGLDGLNPVRFTPAETLRWLVSFHAHARTGMWPNTTGSGPAPGVPGPLVDKLLAVPAGPDVGRTVALSLVAGPGLGVRGGLPPWRRDEAVLGRPPASVVELLAHTTRHVLVAPDGDRLSSLLVGVNPGISPVVPRAVVAAGDPHIAAIATERNPDGWSLARYDPDKAAWRAAPALSAAQAGALAMRALPGRANVIGDDGARIEVFGLKTESGGKYVSWIRESTDLSPAAVHMIDALRAAESFAQAGGLGLQLIRQRTGQLPTPPPIAARRSVAAAFARAYWPVLAGPGADLATDLRQADGPGCIALLDRWRRYAGQLAHRVLDEMTRALRPTLRTTEAMSAGHRAISSAVWESASLATAVREETHA